MPPLRNLDDLSPAERKAPVLELLTEVAALKEGVAQQRAQIARLKGLQGPPTIKPCGMEKASEAKPPSASKKRRRRGRQRVRVAIEERVLKAEVPAGSRFKGCESYRVQDLVLELIAIRFRRERWATPDGESVVAPLPPGTTAISARSCAASCWRNIIRARSPRRGRWRSWRQSASKSPIQVSKCPVVRLLIGRQDRFCAEAQVVLRAGLAQAAGGAADDTGARHKARNGFCTDIGNDRFARFGTTRSKSRRNFRDILRPTAMTATPSTPRRSPIGAGVRWPAR